MSIYVDKAAEDQPVGRGPDRRARSGHAIQVAAVSGGYGFAKIIDGVDIRVGNGQVVLIAGPNGSGKSTLLKIVMGELSCGAGRVRVMGQDTTGWSTAKLARFGVGYVPQIDDVFLNLTIKENLLLGGYLLLPKERRERLASVLELFPALARTQRQPASVLSGGQRKLLALARVLMLEPEVIILDEPTAGLAPGVASDLLDGHIARLQESGRSILMVEQRVMDALKVVDWVYVLVGGKVALSESSQAFSERSDAARWLMGVGQVPDVHRTTEAPFHR